MAEALGEINTVHVAVAVIQQGDQILIALRPDTAHQGGLWEFPGGKVEREESVEQALHRELQEELGISIDLDDGIQPLIKIRHDYGDKVVLLDVWIVERFKGIPTGVEGQPVRWVDRSLLTDYEFPEANKPIIKAVQLPRKYLIIGEFGSASECLERLQKAISCHSIKLVQFRAHELYRRDADAFLAVANEVLALCRQHDVTLVINGLPELLNRVDADGVHMPFDVASKYQTRPLSGDKYLGISCHSEKQLAHARTLQPDYVVLSPVKPTRSHPGATLLGWRQFKALVSSVNFPVYALGGLDDGDLEQSIKESGQGVAAISAWW